MAAVTICRDFGAPKNKVCHCFHCFPIYFPMKWWDQMPWSSFSECWALSQLFPLSSFTFFKRLFSFSSLSAISVVSSAYLRLLIFLPAILILACASSSPGFLIMHSAYKLSKQGDNIQPWYTPFPIWNQSVVPCPVLHPLDHRKSKRAPEKTSTSALLTLPQPLTVWITINCGKFWKR